VIAQVIDGAVATAGVVSAVIGVLGYRLQARQANRQAREFLALLLRRGASMLSASTGPTSPTSSWTRPRAGERLRFDAAHELGHLVLQCEHGAPQGREAEQQAHRFAGALLMPRAAVLAANLHNASLDQLLRAKRTWRVAAMALAHRLHELGLLTDWRYREMCIELSRRGYRRSEPGGVPHETSHVLTEVLSALRAQKVGIDQIADELGWEAGDVRAHLFGLALTSQPGDGDPTPTRPSTLHALR